MKKIFLFSILFFIFLSCSKNPSSETKTEPTQAPEISSTLTDTPTPAGTFTQTPTSTFTSTFTFTNSFTSTVTLTSTSTSTPITVEVRCSGTPLTCTNYDTVIIENTSNNYGTLQSNSLGFDGSNKRRVLMKFDVSSIPATATVLEARLIFYVNNFSNAASNPFFVGAHKINSDWGELTETWQTHNGGDFDVNIMAGSNVSGTGSWTIFLTPSVVEGWIKGTIPNYGVLLKQGTENTVQDYIDISMKEWSTENERPYLIIKYIN